ncbi:MAG: hypothetical protein GY870_02525 [archaeon]|nr:hypothetical protein [archaeon]
MSKEKLIETMEKAWDNGIPFIDYTDFYVYCLIPKTDGKWSEVSYDIGDKTIDEREINGTIAYRMLIEEMEKGISGELEDFMLGTFKDFRIGLGDKPEGEKLVDIIKELTENSATYSKNLPILSSKDNIADISGKL